jgi:hypothetical protein
MPVISGNRFDWEFWIRGKRAPLTFSPILGKNSVKDGNEAISIINSYSEISWRLPNLSELIDNIRTDKNTCHSYLPTYEILLGPLRDVARNVLEIGICAGGSIKLWKDFFRYAQIHGVDIMPLSDIWPVLNHSRISIHAATDGYSAEFVDKTFRAKGVSFDVLLDDGPHTLQSLYDFLDLYLPLLHAKGVLIIEDIQSPDWIELLRKRVPESDRKFLRVFDLRSVKGRYDDLLFVIDRNFH